MKIKNERRLSPRTGRQVLSTASLFSILFTAMASPAYATSVQTSKFYTGLIEFLNDLMSVSMIACPVVGGLAAVYFTIRRSMADEQDGKMWTKRIVTAIICGVLGGLITGIIALITSYVTTGAAVPTPTTPAA